MERKPIYQAVTSIEPYCMKEYKNFNSASQVNPLAIIKKLYLKTVNHGLQSYDICNYLFLSNTARSEVAWPFIIDNWSIEEIYEGYFHGYQEDEKTEDLRFSAWNEYIIADTNGEIQRFHFASPEEALKQILVFSKYKTWMGFNSENQPIKYQ